MLDADTRLVLNNMIKLFIGDGMEEELKFARQLLQLADHPDKVAIQELLDNYEYKYRSGEPDWINMIHWLRQMAKAVNQE